MTPSDIAYITERATKLDNYALRATILNRGYSIADYIGFGSDATKEALARVMARPAPTSDHPSLAIFQAEFKRRVQAQCGM